MKKHEDEKIPWSHENPPKSDNSIIVLCFLQVYHWLSLEHSHCRYSREKMEQEAKKPRSRLQPNSFDGLLLNKWLQTHKREVNCVL